MAKFLYFWKNKHNYWYTTVIYFTYKNQSLLNKGNLIFKAEEKKRCSIYRFLILNYFKIFTFSLNFLLYWKKNSKFLQKCLELFFISSGNCKSLLEIAEMSIKTDLQVFLQITTFQEYNIIMSIYCQPFISFFITGFTFSVFFHKWHDVVTQQHFKLAILHFI